MTSHAETNYYFLPKEALSSQMESIPVDAEQYNVPVFKGFRYFSPLDFKEWEEGTRFVVAMRQKEIIGVMKTKRYAISDHAFVEEEDRETPSYIAIRYVDVQGDWKRKGIATRLYQTLNDAVCSSDTVISSPLSTEGEKAGLHSLRNKWITNCPSFNSLDDCEEEMEWDYY